MTIDPIDAALVAMEREGVLVCRVEMQAAIDAYEAARVHSASQDAVRALTEQAQAAGLYEAASADLPNPHLAVASPQTPQTACGDFGDVAAVTARGQVWLSLKSGTWWRVKHVSAGSVCVEGPRGHFAVGSVGEWVWPGTAMTADGFEAWKRKHEAVLLAASSAAEVTRFAPVYLAADALPALPNPGLTGDEGGE